MGAEGERGLVKENHMETWCDSEGVKHLNNKKKRKRREQKCETFPYIGETRLLFYLML